MPLMGLRAYARHRGCRLNAVQTAVAAGRIRCVRGQIDSDQADADWEANTDPLAGQGSPSRHDSGGGSASARYIEERANRERIRRQREELEYGREVRELVPVEEFEARLAHVISVSRAKVLALPSKVKQRLSHLTTKDVLTIDALVREALEDLASVELGSFEGPEGLEVLIAGLCEASDPEQRLAMALHLEQIAADLKDLSGGEDASSLG